MRFFGPHSYVKVLGHYAALTGSVYGMMLDRSVWAGDVIVFIVSIGQMDGESAFKIECEESADGESFSLIEGVEKIIPESAINSVQVLEVPLGIRGPYVRPKLTQMGPAPEIESVVAALYDWRWTSNLSSVGVGE